MDICGALLLILLVAIVPTVAYVFLIWWLDRYEKEPWGMLIAAFLWGGIPSILAALILQLLVLVPLASLGAERASFISSTVVAPVTEELVKGFLLLIFFFLFRREFDSTLDGIIYGALVGAGFAMTENVLYYFGAYSEGGMQNVLVLAGLRGVIFGLNHSLFTSVFGASLGAVRYKPGFARLFIPLLGIMGAILLHSIHNFAAELAAVFCFSLVFVLLSDWGGLLVVLVVAIMSLRREAQWIRNELAEEVGYGIISPEDLYNAASWRRRYSMNFNEMGKRGLGGFFKRRKYYQLLTELSYKKHQYRTLGNEANNLNEIQALRREIANMRTGLV